MVAYEYSHFLLHDDCRYSWLPGALRRDRDQYQAKVAGFTDQAIQRGLIGDQARDNRAAVGVMGDREAVEPRRPVQIEMSFNTNLVMLWHDVSLVFTRRDRANFSAPMCCGDGASLAAGGLRYGDRK